MQGLSKIRGCFISPLMVSLVYPEACLELGRKAFEGNHELVLPTAL